MNNLPDELIGHIVPVGKCFDDGDVTGSGLPRNQYYRLQRTCRMNAASAAVSQLIPHIYGPI